jgi:hypothetical protein
VFVHVLLTGAGFTKNWDGLLAGEIQTALIGDPQVRGRSRLLKLVANQPSFELAYGIAHKAPYDEDDRASLEASIKDVHLDNGDDRTPLSMRQAISLTFSSASSLPLYSHPLVLVVRNAGETDVSSSETRSSAGFRTGAAGDARRALSFRALPPRRNGAPSPRTAFASIPKSESARMTWIRLMLPLAR